MRKGKSLSCERSEARGLMGKLTGRVALDAGSGRGIGRAMALADARVGARIGLTSRNRSELQ